MSDECPALASQEPAPLVSVIVAVRNSPSLLQIALMCYRRQTYPNRELIVVEDGAEYVSARQGTDALGGRLIRAPEAVPPGDKLNRGVAAAAGSLCQIFEPGSWYGPQFLKTMVAGLRRDAGSLCQPTIGFPRPFEVLDLASMTARVPLPPRRRGASLLFPRDAWRDCPFRPLWRDEDFWFQADQVRQGARLQAVNTLGHHVVLGSDASLDNALLAPPGAASEAGGGAPAASAWRGPGTGYALDMLPAWAIETYHGLRQALASRTAEVGHEDRAR